MCTLRGVRKAAVDVGSNSVLLTVEEFDGGGWKPVFETSKVTALGEGIPNSGSLTEPGMSRTLEAVRQAFADARKHGAEEIIAAGTMALRIAKNAEDFLESATDQGTPVLVLSGEDEARLGFLGAALDPRFAPLQKLAVVDVGGHSTEIVAGSRNESSQNGWEIGFRKSFPVGTLGLINGPLIEECPGPPARLAAARIVDEKLGSIPEAKDTGVVTLGATGTNLVAIRERLAEWQPEKVHGSWLSFEETSKAFARLSDMRLKERSQLIGMEPGREKTLHAGALILERGLHALKAEGCFVSVRGWRHALLEHGQDREVEGIEHEAG